MPLLYGEGKKAFVRFQEEIVKSSEDLSILAWGFQSNHFDQVFQVGQHQQGNAESPYNEFGVFASSPHEYRHCGRIISSPPSSDMPTDMNLNRVFR